MELKVMRVISFQYPVPLRWDGKDVERAIIRALDKVLDYTTRAKSCTFHDWVKSTGKQPKAHDCRKNHISSSKAMEPDAAVELFNRAPTQGVKFSIYTGDDDSTTEAHIRQKVAYHVGKIQRHSSHENIPYHTFI